MMATCTMEIAGKGRLSDGWEEFKIIFGSKHIALVGIWRPGVNEI